MDWNLNTCSRRGHVTYAPTEPELRVRLTAQTAAGETWRCLRCGDYVVGPAHSSGPADAAPEVPRGPVLRDRRIQRLLAVERGVRAIALLGLAVGVYVFRNTRGGLEAAFDRDLPLLRPFATQLGWNLDDSRIVRGIDRIFSLSPTTLVWIAVGLVAYAAIEGVEAYGLWRMVRWGEYFAVVATSIFLPWEIYEITEKVTALRVVLLLINIAAVAWLIWSKRLFGARGGDAAYRAEHSAESLLTVERSAVQEIRPASHSTV